MLLPYKLTACAMVLALVLIYLLSAVSVAQLTVNLDYASYKGVRLSGAVTQWLGMRYAAAPVGELRFVPPKNPPTVRGVRAANKVRSLARVPPLCR